MSLHSGEAPVSLRGLEKSRLHSTRSGGWVGKRSVVAHRAAQHSRALQRQLGALPDENANYQTANSALENATDLPNRVPKEC